MLMKDFSSLCPISINTLNNHSVLCSRDFRFGGDPAPNTHSTTQEENPTVIEQIKLRAADTVQSFIIDMVRYLNEN